MNEPSPPVAQPVALRLNDLLGAACLEPLGAATADSFANYCALLLRWNARMNLTAVRDEDGILSRHFVESIFCARALPAGIATLLDFGSGAGFPGIPIALCRPEIFVTLAESQGKKAAFLREVVRSLELSSTVYSGRAELLTVRFDGVVLRAVDKMPKAFEAARGLVTPGGWIALLTTEGELAHLRAAAGEGLTWNTPIQLAGSERRILALAH